MAYQHILTEFKQGLGTITLNRPCECPNIAMMEEINDALKGFQGKKDLKWFSQRQRKMLFRWRGCREHMGDLAPKMIEAFIASSGSWTS